MANRKMNVDGNFYCFNFSFFNLIFNEYKLKVKTKVGVLEEELAEYVNKEIATVHNWRNRTSGPSDLDTVKLIAKYFGLEDYKILLVEKEVEEKMGALTDLQILSVKRVYDSIIDYLEEFDKSNGFNDYWFDLESDPKHRKDKLLDIAMDRVDKVILVFKKEYMLLRNLKIYNELESYIYDDLYETFDNKLSYGYRFEAQVDGNPTTDEDYYRALNKINSIIDKYIP